jgi:hypothetical protein
MGEREGASKDEAVARSSRPGVARHPERLLSLRRNLHG